MTGLRLLEASSRFTDDEIAAYREAIGFDELLGTAAGELELMNTIATALEDDSLRA